MSDETLRDNRGLWKKGTPSPNPKGRPRREVEAHNIDVFCEAITDEDLTAIARSHVSFAKAGNVQSARLIFDYKLGKPTEHVAIEAEAGDDIQLTWGVLTASANRVSDQSDQLPDNPELPALPDGQSEV